MKECKDCKKEYEKTSCPTCFNCIMKEADKEFKLKELKHPRLINIWESLNFGIEVEAGEPGHYDDYSYLTNEQNDSIEGLLPEDLVKLYEAIIKEAFKEAIQMCNCESCADKMHKRYNSINLRK